VFDVSLVEVVIIAFVLLGPVAVGGAIAVIAYRLGARRRPAAVGPEGRTALDPGPGSEPDGFVNDPRPDAPGPDR